MTLFLALLFPLWGTVGQLCAAPVTAEKARQQAKAFLTSRIASGSGPRHAPGVTPQLMQEKQVSGLYVFNVSNDGGFVIVSNDDIAEPILGYSDSGTIDPENMPSNMRAWLQGYADEIAWAKEHGITNARPAKAPRHHTEASVKTPIEPLVKTKWNQDAPYNMYTPYYGVDSNGYYVYSTDQIPENITWSHCATGCVATAMAQVMKYHEWPEKPTKDIPGYNWENKNETIAGLSANSAEFAWYNMKNTYESEATGYSANAVALLMQYCGWSVKMNYGRESGSNSAKLANALTEYFDYKATVTCVDRACYSYANWINLLYHELAEKRPVVYSGQSSGGGHEFVSDGYQGEDYFHINWGWGGSSDSYFKLSSLNPYAQGIGGSSTRDGFRYWQDAVIGIQKPSENGTILDVDATINMKLNSITLSKETIEEGESVDVTVDVTNSSTDEYDGDIILYVEGRGPIDGKAFLIAPGERKACVITIAPRQGTYTIVPILGNGYYITPKTTVTLTVNESTAGKPTTSNIDLGCTLEVENVELISDKNYYILGNTFKATLTVSNPSTQYDYLGTFQYDLFENKDYETPVAEKYRSVRIPAEGSITIPITYNGMKFDNEYELDVVYEKVSGDKRWSDWEELGFYTACPAVTNYSADGTRTLAKLNGTSYAAPDEALVIDVTGTGVTEITPNSQANAIYIYSGTRPEGLNGKNVIKYDDTYTAESITLTDDQPFYSPVDFTAGNISFAYQFTVGADGRNGWNTLCLPFNVSSVTANGTAIDWFRSVKDTGKNFWLKHFTSDESNKVYFDFADAIKANTPYIVAFPGNAWGNKWDMSNKEIKFIGENVTVSKGGKTPATTGNNYRFYGNTVPDATENIYCLNSDGNAFVLTKGSRPFRAYFKPGSFDRTVTSLAIASGTGVTTAIDSLPSTLLESEGAWFDLQGRQVVQPTKGLYIVNGKKVIVK